MVAVDSESTFVKLTLTLTMTTEVRKSRMMILLPQWSKTSSAHWLKITQNVSFEFLNFAIFKQLLSSKNNLSGNTFWPQAMGSGIYI